MAGLNSLALVPTLICLSVVAVGGTSPPEPPICPAPPEGRIYYPGCAPCDGTCENPNPPCLAICRPGCACPKGQVIKDRRKCVDKTECPPPACPVRGQIYYPDCAPCDGTCDNPNPVCPKICKPGCACPEGQVIFDRKACINKTECPQVCPTEGQIYYPECAPCDGTCENPNPPCPKICRPGCACPEGQVIKDGKCVDKTKCPPPACPVMGQIYYPDCAPCDGTCDNPNPVCPKICKPGCACPEGQVIFDRKACINKTECPQVCPIEGQIYYPECAPCDGTCENPNPVCPKICRPGCACPIGQVIKDGKCVNKTECPPPACPVMGQIYYPECVPCDGTCDNPNPVCPKICKPGCACPEGQVIFDRKACINKTECPQVCPIEGQIYYPECAPCDGTCENPNPKCPKICRAGCACPIGQVIKDGKCVDKTECPPVCPIKGQIYYPECAPCNGTCENPKPACPKICVPGCACPRGKVIKNGRRCVNPNKCEAEACDIKGQIYYPECAPCDGTCKNPNPVCPLVCKPGCACPRGKVIRKGKKCVNPKNC